jgi:hypothetical protein
MTKAEFEVDLSTRQVRAHIRREFDVTPITVTIPFAVLKGIVGTILIAEGEAEKAQHGRPQLVTTSSLEGDSDGKET